MNSTVSLKMGSDLLEDCQQRPTERIGRQARFNNAPIGQLAHLPARQDNTAQRSSYHLAAHLCAERGNDFEWKGLFGRVRFVG